MRALSRRFGLVALPAFRLAVSVSRPEIIRQAIWLYLRFTLTFREMEDLRAVNFLVSQCDLGMAILKNFDGPDYTITD